MVTPPTFTPEDAKRAHEEWGANCGPGALAAIMGMTLDEIAPIMFAVGFAEKQYTNPTMMNDALRRIGRPWRKVGAVWPQYGLVRIQWEGPWTAPGVPMRARYRHTHWIGACARNPVNIGVFDINCMNSNGWVSLDDWAQIIVPHIIKECVPRGDGKWHITHAIEVGVNG